MTDQKAVTALQPFLILSKSAVGRSAADLIVQATQAPGCFVFAELLAQPNIQNLVNNTEGNKYLDLLRIFAYKGYMDYKISNVSLPPLNEKQLEKLKQLSLISIASRGARNLTYSSLIFELDLDSVNTLENLVISAIYAGLLQAKLDTKFQFVEVSSTAGRDVAPEDVPSMIETLTDWCALCEGVLADIDIRMKAVHSEAVSKRKEKDEYIEMAEKKKEGLREEKALSLGSGKGKRVISEGEDGRGPYENDGMDLDEDYGGSDGRSEWGGANTSRRRTKGRFGGAFGGLRGNKRR